MIAKGQKINDRYEIDKLIGEGGMANVYLAHDTILYRKVAVKVLRGDLAGDDKFVRRFQREALAASSLSHPNIVEIYDVGEDDGNGSCEKERRPIRNECVFKQVPVLEQRLRVKSIEEGRKVFKEIGTCVEIIDVHCPFRSTKILERHQNGVEVDTHVKNCKLQYGVRQHDDIED